VRERDGVDLMSPPGVSRSSNGQSRDSNDETDNDPPEHETSLADSTYDAKIDAHGRRYQAAIRSHPRVQGWQFRERA